ncbi:MAG TPA: hypothetical protein DHW82_01865, partial [Spirochaetia bacterium]|nr:hypothetical protein [Spirochaetia bacterium]
MGFKKTLALLTLVFFLSSCFILKKKAELETLGDYPPLPEFLLKKKLVILPFENLSGKAEYDFVLKSLPSLIYSYFRFIKTYPFQMEIAELKNEQAFFDYFGEKSPTPEQRKIYINASLEMNQGRKDINSDGSKLNKESGNTNTNLTINITSPYDESEVKGFVRIQTSVFSSTGAIDRVEFYVDNVLEQEAVKLSPYELNWDTSKVGDGYHDLMVKIYDSSGTMVTDNDTRVKVNNSGTPLKEESLEEKMKLPDFFELEVFAPGTSIKDLKKNYLILKAELNPDFSLKLYIYDTMRQTHIYEKILKLPPVSINLLTMDEEAIRKTLNIGIKSFLEDFSGKAFYELTLDIQPQGAVVYIDENFIESKTVLLPEGKHFLKTIKTGFESLNGSFFLKENQSLPFSLKEIKKNIKLFIETIPKESPVFVDAAFAGLSPVEILVAPGVHQVRVSREGYEHQNEMVKVYDFDKEKSVSIQLKKESLNLEEDRKTINTIKNFAFFSFFPFLGAHMYCQEKTDYYKEKFDVLQALKEENNEGFIKAVNMGLNETYKKYDFYQTAAQFFKNGSIMLLFTAAILQITELEMDDVGIGIDSDKR